VSKGKHNYPDRYSYLTGTWTADSTDVVKTPLTRKKFVEHFFITESRVQGYQFKQSQYDLIIASNLLHYLFQRSTKKLLERLMRHLESNGLVYIRFKRDPEYGPWKEGFSYEECRDLCRSIITPRGIAEWTQPTPNGSEDCVFTNL
jgi:hypothetical protein